MELKIFKHQPLAKNYQVFCLHLEAALAGIIISFNPNKYFHPNLKPIKTTQFHVCQNKISNCQVSRGQLENQPLMNDLSRSDGQAETTDSKLDKTFDEIIQLVVRDFLLFSTNDLLWDTDTMETLAKYGGTRGCLGIIRFAFFSLFLLLSFKQ
jgi:hypothetical protein